MASSKNRDNDRMMSPKDWVSSQSRGFEPTCVKLPDGVEFYKLEPGVHQVDFIPYRAGKLNKRADEGHKHYELEYEASRLPTMNGSRMFCNRKLFGKKDAVTVWLTNNGGAADRELVASIRPRVRQLWIVNDKPGDSENPLKVMDQAYFNRGVGFGELMADVLASLDEDAQPFALSGGYMATLTVKRLHGNGFDYNGVTRIDLRPRKYDYPKSVLDRAPCLDECLVDPGYDEVMNLLETGGFDKVKPSGKEEAKNADDDGKTADDCGLVKGDHVEFNDDIYTIVKISSDGTNLTLRNDDDEDDVQNGVDPTDVEKVEEKPKPTKKQQLQTKKAATQDDEDEELEGPDDDESDDEDLDSDWEDDDEETVKATKKSIKSIRD